MSRPAFNKTIRGFLRTLVKLELASNDDFYENYDIVYIDYVANAVGALDEE